MPQQTADVIALILAAIVAVVVILTAMSLLYIEISQPSQDTSAAGDFVSRVVSVLVAALVGYMAGRQVRNGHGS